MNAWMPRDVDIALFPGQVHAARATGRVRTLLGSCVAIVLWHPGMRVGAICHFMLGGASPVRPRGELDGRYAEDAMQMLVMAIVGLCCRPEQMTARLFGGGRMFQDERPALAHSVSERNVSDARRLLREHGIPCLGEHVGGSGHRQLLFDLVSGEIWLRHRPLRSEMPVLCLPSPTQARPSARGGTS